MNNQPGKIWTCPRCGDLNGENWPLSMPDGTVKDGGCQMCWEAQCSEEWWCMMATMNANLTFKGFKFWTGLFVPMLRYFRNRNKALKRQNKRLRRELRSLRFAVKALGLKG